MTPELTMLGWVLAWRVRGRKAHAGLTALLAADEEPVLASDRKGADGILGQCVADVQTTIVEISDQVNPLIQGVLNGFGRQAIFRHTAGIGLQPGFQVLENRLAELLPLRGFLCGLQILDPLFDGVELADLADGHIRLADLLPLLLWRRGLAGFDEFPTGMVPAANTLDRVIPAHLVVP